MTIDALQAIMSLLQREEKMRVSTLPRGGYGFVTLHTIQAKIHRIMHGIDGRKEVLTVTVDAFITLTFPGQ